MRNFASFLFLVDFDSELHILAAIFPFSLGFQSVFILSLFELDVTLLLANGILRQNYNNNNYYYYCVLSAQYA
jgi:hypothetical protein